MSQPMLDRASRFSLQGKRAQADLGTVEGPRTVGQDCICGQVVFIDGGYRAV